MINNNFKPLEGNYVSKSDFLAYSEDAKSTGNKYNLSYLRDKMNYDQCECPRCKTNGYFRVYFLGKIYHDECGWQGYSSWLEYLAYQVSYAYYASRKLRYAMKEENEQAPNLFHSSIGYLWGLIRFFYIGIPLVGYHVTIKSFYKK